MSREIFGKLLRVLRNLKGFLGADLMRVRLISVFKLVILVLGISRKMDIINWGISKKKFHRNSEKRFSGSYPIPIRH